MYEEVDKYLAESKRLQAVHNQAIGEYLRLVEAHGKDPMTEESLTAYRKAVEAHSAVVAHLENAPGRKKQSL